MTPLALRLAAIDSRINSHRAGRVALLGFAAFAALWTAVAACDRIFRPEDSGRWLLGGPLWLALLASFGFALRVLLSKKSTEAIARSLEKAYPELDDRLMNRVQFEAKKNQMPTVSVSFLTNSLRACAARFS